MSGFLDRVKGAFVEEVPQENFNNGPIEDIVVETPANWDGQIPETKQASDIYTEIGLGDISKSVLKVGEVLKGLPDVDTANKKKMAINMLPVLGMSVEVVIEDAEARINALDSAMQIVNSEVAAVTLESQDKIIELTAQIDELKAKMSAAAKVADTQKQIIDTEKSCISNILTFIQ